MVIIMLAGNFVDTCRMCFTREALKMLLFLTTWVSSPNLQYINKYMPSVTCITVYVKQGLVV